MATVMGTSYTTSNTATTDDSGYVSFSGPEPMYEQPKGTYNTPTPWNREEEKIATALKALKDDAPAGLMEEALRNPFEPEEARGDDARVEPPQRNPFEAKGVESSKPSGGSSFDAKSHRLRGMEEAMNVATPMQYQTSTGEVYVSETLDNGTTKYTKVKEATYEETEMENGLKYRKAAKPTKSTSFIPPSFRDDSVGCAAPMPTATGGYTDASAGKKVRAKPKAKPAPLSDEDKAIMKELNEEDKCWVY